MLASLLKAWPWSMAVLAGSLQIQAVDGTRLRPLEPAGMANVLLFVATDCPISNSYAPEIQRICSAYAASGIGCALIYEDAGVTVRAAIARGMADGTAQRYMMQRGGRGGARP